MDSARQLVALARSRARLPEDAALEFSTAETRAVRGR